MVAIAAAEIKSYAGGSVPGDPNTSMFVDSETGKAFPHRNVVGEMAPVVSPFTGTKTGYPGVPCYWTASGEVKTDPDWLLLNQQVGKTGPTFCPYCGRLVVIGRPPPKPGDRPPPTREELLHSNPAPFKGPALRS
jgi:hypothetical protein